MQLTVEIGLHTFANQYLDGLHFDSCFAVLLKHTVVELVKGCSDTVLWSWSLNQKIFCGAKSVRDEGAPESVHVLKHMFVSPIFFGYVHFHLHVNCLTMHSWPVNPPGMTIIWGTPPGYIDFIAG